VRLPPLEDANIRGAEYYAASLFEEVGEWQTLDKLHALRWFGLAEAWRKQMENPEVGALSFDERLALVLDQHWTWRESQAITRRLKTSKLDAGACVEDIDFRHPRGLDRSLMRSLSNSQWVAQHLSILFTGPAGIGKS